MRKVFIITKTWEYFTRKVIYVFVLMTLLLVDVAEAKQEVVLLDELSGKFKDIITRYLLENEKGLEELSKTPIETISYKNFDLNNDGIDEIFYFLPSVSACNAAGECPYLIFKENKNKKYEIIFGAQASAGSLSILSSKTDGYYDIEIGGKHNSSSIWKWDKTAYGLLSVNGENSSFAKRNMKDGKVKFSQDRFERERKEVFKEIQNSFQVQKGLRKEDIWIDKIDLNSDGREEVFAYYKFDTCPRIGCTFEIFAEDKPDDLRSLMRVATFPEDLFISRSITMNYKDIKFIEGPFEEVVWQWDGKKYNIGKMYRYDENGNLVK